jgi:hypothetical protein
MYPPASIITGSNILKLPAVPVNADGADLPDCALRFAYGDPRIEWKHVLSGLIQT